MDIKLIIDELKKEKEKLESRIEKINSVIKELESIEEGPGDTKESIEKAPRKKFYQPPTFAEIRKKRGRPKKLVTTSDLKSPAVTAKKRRSHRWTDEILEFIRKCAEMMDIEEIIKEIESKFNIKTNKPQVVAVMNYRNIKLAVKKKRGFKKGMKRGPYGPHKKRISKDIPERKIEPAYYHGQKVVCPKCGSFRIWKHGMRNGVQRFRCKDCSKIFFVAEKNESSKERTSCLLAEEKEANREGLEGVRDQKPFSMDQVPEGMEGEVEE